MGEVAAAQELRITEIFLSIQGESASVGWPTVFVRLTGCPLRCVYCDTTYSFTGGELMTLEAILDQVEAHGVSHVCVTGGEPLAQPECLDLLTALCDQGYQVSLETSGALDISRVDPRVMTVMDLKTPSSGEAHRNLLSNLAHLKPTDQIKFVLAGREDYDWAVDQLRQHDLASKAQVLFSPVFKDQSPADLAEWILHDKLPVRMQLQLHKLLWGEARGR
ncbi:7-carboxy-7-deazaguanine synthase [Ectothiorhodosinus mongolicus]|uniref:7-carboxy-7-deazaguanine synthase n=1 Tax=Ectothiorhodosinus mongolicus TaxID=233100 RepID=A0A1R3W3Z5_9GAMM|nr:7-carboxy-7-deazaguanine synthase QueE [Ectothiorhodosinus mongolicus]ULX57389.1 7-carboxy-7-deazaguanine synthase QueE [Ectothiorhodosinus mongolicus]SIT71336.1 7-carboxy-7-deazaguanine synthase [Ectothiorhodosinus mongolicus]